MTRARLTALTAALVAATLVAGCGDGELVAASPRSGATPADGWRTGTPMPLSPRDIGAVAWTGAEVLVVGGDDSAPCPPTASCTGPDHYRRDGAAYDPATGRWRALPDAPAEIPPYAAVAWLDGRMYVQAGRRILAFEPEGNTWTTLPGSVPEWQDLVAHDRRLITVSGSDELGVRPDRAFDPVDGTWADLPEDPLGASFDRGAVSTPRGLVLLAKRLVPDPGRTPAYVRAAVLRDGRWRLLADSDQLGGGQWAWTGQRLVDAALGGADGGEVDNYGRTIPFGGRLDPATGTWSRLPRTPEEGTGGWPVEAAGRLVAANGYVYDDAIGTWTRLRRPPDAPDSPGSTVWAGTDLVVLGGHDDDRREAEHHGRTAAVWLWAPGAAP